MHRSSAPAAPAAGITARERRAMSAALTAARRGQRGATPLVGAAVIGADGTIVTGYHAGAGHPHAEPAALAAALAAGIDLGTATLVVTLEPCAHVGRTPSCAHTIVRAGIPRIVYAAADPNPVAAGGAEVLRAAGREVVAGLAADEAAVLNHRWVAAQREARPFVTAKLAQSLDGRIAAADGTSQWITSDETRSRVHALRARVDAVIVGTGTARADNPRLTARIDGRAAARQPVPVVIGTRDLDASSHLAADPRTIHLRTHDLLHALRQLRARGIEHVLVEGGAHLLSGFLTAGLVDELFLHLGPQLLGTGGLAATAGLEVPTLAAAPRFIPDDLAAPAAAASGTDTILHLRPAPAAPAPAPPASSTTDHRSHHMFTGIIEATGTVLSVTSVPGTDTARISIRAGSLIDDLPAGGSLAVNGVCLTATRTSAEAAPADENPASTSGPGIFTADIMGETLARTSLGALRAGAQVNLERCMPASGRFDGHIVQGHVDGVGRISVFEDCGAWTRMRIELPAALAPLCVEKGSIALDGTSLTITAVSSAGAGQPWCEVGLIPATLAATTFRQASVGDLVNIETDVLAKYAQSLAGRHVRRADPVQAPPSPWQDKPWETTAADASPAHGLDSIEEAISRLRRGVPTIVVDDADRENEGDLIVPAELLSPEWMGFIVRHTSGVVCAPMTAEIAAHLDLPAMTAVNEDPKGTNYTVSCDARGLDTGISAGERTTTLRMLADPQAGPEQLTRPGHVFPLIAAAGGVRERAGHTEAGVELARLAGCRPVAAIAEVVDDTGEVMRLDALLAFGTRFGLPVISIADLRTWLDTHTPAAHQN